MRKSRTVVKDVDFSEHINLNPAVIFSALAKMDVVVPSWGIMMFVFAKAEKKTIDISFFEDPKEFFLWYTKILVRGTDDMTLVSFSKENEEWKLFAPPTLIGVNLRTKLRFDA